jgi:hypothetical protein
VKLAKFRKPKTTFFKNHMWNIGLVQIQQYYEKQTSLHERGRIKEET